MADLVQRVDTDGDYAGCVLTGKSTTGAHLSDGLNLDSKLEVGRKELLRRSQSASILLRTKSMVRFGDGVGQCAFDTDSSLAKSIMERRGVARIKHLHCPMLWLQERVDSGEIHTENRRGQHNTAGVGTDAVSAEVQRRHVKKLKVEWREGRHPIASRAVL